MLFSVSNRSDPKLLGRATLHHKKKTHICVHTGFLLEVNFVFCACICQSFFMRLLISVTVSKAGLLRLLSGLAFLFFGLLKQVNIAVERKTKGAIFAPFSVSVILFSG